MLALGLISLFGSALYAQYVLAFIGLGLAFWGALLLYLRPSRYVRLDLLTASAASSMSDIERILVNMKLKENGIYLPPKNLKVYQSSLVFVPSEADSPLPQAQDTADERLHSGNLDGALLTPPGLALSMLFQRRLHKSFMEMNLNDVERELPKLFDELEITKTLSIHSENDTVTVEASNHIFRDLCEETRKLTRTHAAVGCPLTSAIACALAKAAGKPVTIEKEMQTGDYTRILYRLLEK
jgi:hypothetical protein